MRTKALLSVAAIAASAVTAMAQSNVYSLNIVGYATVNVPAGYSILANPLSAGVTNGANEIGLSITGEVILTWNASKSTFTYAQYDPTLGISPSNWYDANLGPSVAPSLPPGLGFFFFNPNSTNTPITFVGQVVPNPSSTNTLSLASGYSMVGSPLPAAVSDITASPVSLPKINSMVVLSWNNATSKYSYASYDATLGISPSNWYDANLGGIPAPGYSIGEGFFFFNPNPGPAAWTQSLP